MNDVIRKLGILLAAVVLGSGLISCAAGSGESAEDYPSDDIRIIVPYTAGGPTDLAARAAALGLEQEFDQTVVVENQPGGGGSVGANQLLSSNPDGYTMGMLATGTVVVAPLLNDVGYTRDDFAYIGAVREIPNVLVVRSDAPYDSTEEFFKAAKDSPGEIDVATPGASTLANLGLQVLQEEYDVPVKPVPFDGTSETLPALLGGNVDALFADPTDPILSSIENGELKPLATDSTERLSNLQDVPSFAEIGYDQLTVGTPMFFLTAPPETPEEILSKLEASLQEALQNPEVVEQIGEEYIPQESISGEEVETRLDEASHSGVHEH